jgi:hypothetical protein
VEPPRRDSSGDKKAPTRGNSDEAGAVGGLIVFQSSNDGRFVGEESGSAFRLRLELARSNKPRTHRGALVDFAAALVAR